MEKVLISANTDWYLYNFRLAFARFLRESGYKVCLVSPPGKHVNRFLQEGFYWVQWNVRRKEINPFEEADSLRSLLRIYREERPDVVHHHTIKPVLYGTIAAKLARVPRIVNSITGRGYVFQSEKAKARLLQEIVKWVFRIIFRFSNPVMIFENQDDLSFYIEKGFAKPINSFLIEGVGVNPVRFSPGPEPEGPPVVLMCSRMLWDKGVGDFVEAARLVKAKTESRFVLVGDPDPGNPESISEDMLRAWDSEGVIEWWGWKADMVPIYKQAHIVALPTRYGEGVPTVLVEGAACGKPLVSSDIPGCRAIVKNEINGYLVSPNDPIALAKSVEKLIRSPALRRDMGIRSRKIVLRKFTHDQINQETVKLYKTGVQPT